VVVVGKSSRKFRPPDNCVYLVNQTSLLQLIRLVRSAQFIVSVDSGPMHIGAAVTDRLLSIHTWTDPRRVGPFNQHAWIWKNRQLLPVSELSGATGLKKNRGFTVSDVAGAVQLIQDRWVPLPGEHLV
jgi:ADP-heptose:LPS heptosyltransferase